MSEEPQAREIERSTRKQTMRQEFANLPNILTYGRILLIPPVMALMLQEDHVANFWAAALFGLAALTDWLDGFLARRRAGRRRE